LERYSDQAFCGFTTLRREGSRRWGGSEGHEGSQNPAGDQRGLQDYAHIISVGETLWLGNAEGPLDMGKVAKAAKASGADKVVRRLKGLRDYLGQVV
jgi:hypothetical protein